VKKTLIIILTICTALVSAQSKRQVAVLPAVADANALDPQGLILLTDKVREIASKNLPMKGFILLKQDVITNRLGGDEELYNACKEGVCIAELTKRISADYGARCDIMKRGNNLAMKFELYSVRDEAILETFTKYPIPIKGDYLSVMLAELEKRLPDAFKKMADTFKEPLYAINLKPETYTPPPPKPDTAKTYTVTVNAIPSNGGTVSRRPFYNYYREGTIVTISAYPSFGYTFSKWVYTFEGEVKTSYDDKITIAMNENITLTAQFQRIQKTKLEALPEPKRKIISGMLTDSRDGKKYRTVKIGNQTWMAENLNYNASGSKYYRNNSANGDKYGRLYTWSAAKEACPVGWHLPNDAEWTMLTDYVGGLKTAGKKLKSTSGWKDRNGNGMDEYGFSALPGGHGNSDGSFVNAGYYGYWWSATDIDAAYAGNRYMYYIYEYVNWISSDKSYLFSVRCVAD